MSRLKLAVVTFRKSYYLNEYIGPSSNLPLVNCMSFSYKFETFGNGNSNNLRTQPQMSTHGDENAETEIGIIEGSAENSIRFSPDLVDERIKESLEPLHAQISALTEMMDRLIRRNLTEESTTANSRRFGHQYESPYSEGPGFSKFSTLPPLTTAAYFPDITITFQHHEQISRKSSVLKTRINIPRI